MQLPRARLGCGCPARSIGLTLVPPYIQSWADTQAKHRTCNTRMLRELEGWCITR